MEVIEKARELGEAIMEDERTKRFQAAKAANDADEELQKLIGEFNLKKMQLNNEYKNDPEEKNKEKLDELEAEIKGLYGTIMRSKAMTDFVEAKNEMDELIGHVNNIIQMSITGEVDEGGCGGHCSGCSGCH